MTAYALSLLTDRKLLIKINKPCKLEKSFLPNEIDWRTNYTNFNGMSQFNYHINWDFNYLKTQFFNINFNNFFTEVDVIILRTGLDLIKLLTDNRNHHDKIQQLGYMVQNFNFEHVFYDWFHKLFKLNEYLDNKLKDLIKISRPRTETKLICAQIRIGGGKDFDFFPLNNTKLYWNFIREKFLLNIKDYKLFVTSDSKQVIDAAIEEFGQNNLLSFKSHSTHIDLINDAKNDQECNQISELYLDFMFLAECDMGVVSQSNFGIFGIMNRKDKNFDNFYIHSNPEELRKNFWKRDNLNFVPFNTSFIYLEHMNHYNHLFNS